MLVTVTMLNSFPKIVTTMPVFTKLAAVALASLVAFSSPARAWGSEGHEIIGQVATHYLSPVVRMKIDAMLATDPTALTPHDLDSEATWADRYRDSDRNTTKVHYLQTRQWHFIDIELDAGDVDAACFQHSGIPTGTPASAGPAADCSLDKINEFTAELSSPDTTPAERLLALQFLLHFIGDLHQPLHSADDHDAGGNAKLVSAGSLGSGNLHGFWDTQFVRQLGSDPVAVGDALAAKITPADVAAWTQGSTIDWAKEAFQIAKTTVYGTLPQASAAGVYALPSSYVEATTPIVSMQLSRAGVRLASVLNRVMAGSSVAP